MSAVSSRLLRQRQRCSGGFRAAHNVDGDGSRLLAYAHAYAGGVSSLASINFTLGGAVYRQSDAGRKWTEVDIATCFPHRMVDPNGRITVLLKSLCNRDIMSRAVEEVHPLEGRLREQQ